MRWVAHLLARRRIERDLADEIRGHLAERIDELVADGMAPADARRAAHREFGNVTLLEEQGREVWRWRSLEDAWSDVRYAMRQLRRVPSFTLATVFVLALGIGAATAVFSVVNGVVLRPLPFVEPDRLVSVQSIDRRDVAHPETLSYPTFFDFRRGNRVFEHLVSYRDDELTLTGRGLPLQLKGQIVSWDLFPLLRVQPVLGRGFLPSEEEKGQRAVVLSHALWTARFGADPSVVGTSVMLDSQPYTVVGIAPEGFSFPVGNRRVQAWTTLARDAASETITPITEQRGARLLEAIARLRDGETVASAQAQLDSVAAAAAREYPDQNGNLARTYIRPELEHLAGDTRAPLFMLFGAVTLVLLIACANVANMLLARTADREREFGVRLAIGGSRGRIVRQLLTENLLLAVLGSIAGTAGALVAIRFALPLVADSIPRALEVEVDGRVLAFSVGLAVLTSLVFSIPSALRVRRANVGDALRDGTRGSTDTHDRLRGTLVVAQIAIGLMLSSGASLLVSDVARLMRRDPGFQPGGLAAFSISLPGARYPAARQIDFVEQLLDRVKALPAVTAAAAAMPLPLAGDQITVSFNIEERPSPPSSRPRSDMAIVTPGYFRAIGTPLVDGREFTQHDDDTAPAVLIVNQAFARRFFPGERAVGKRITPGATSRRGTMLYEIVGIVGNARQSVVTPDPQPIYYFAFRQLPWGPPPILVRASVPPLTLESSFRQAVTALDKDVPLDGFRTFDDMLASSTAGPRFLVLLMGSFALIALLLTAAGVYGVLAYSILRRTREIGVRIALGASRRMVVGIVLRRAMVLVLIGVPVGIAGALTVDTLLLKVLTEARSGSGPLLALASSLVILTAGIAAYVPARRAASIDPTLALRTE